MRDYLLTFARLFFYSRGLELGGREGKNRVPIESYTRGFYQALQGFSGGGESSTQAFAQALAQAISVPYNPLLSLSFPCPLIRL